MGMIIGIVCIGLLLTGAVGVITYLTTDESIIWTIATSVGTLLIVGVISIYYFYGTATGERSIKTIKSDVTGGIERTVDVYDQNGHLIKTYEGKLDVEDTQYGNKVLFDLNGKRKIIYNATVIVEEK